MMRLRLVTIVMSVVASCATGGEETGWIRTGVTTKDDVVARFGPPDSTIHLPPHVIAIYRGRQIVTPAPGPAIPMIVPTPRGPVPTEMSPHRVAPLRIEGEQPEGEQLARRPLRDFWIRYDRQAVVEEIGLDRPPGAIKAAP